MLALLDFEPKFCPNCGAPINWNDRQLLISFCHGKEPRYCRCKLTFRMTESSKILFESVHTPSIQAPTSENACLSLEVVRESS